MQVSEGRPPCRLLQGAAYGKYNRILPRGWSAEHVECGDNRQCGDSTATAIFRVEAIEVNYSVTLAGAGPWTLEATLCYQSSTAPGIWLNSSRTTRPKYEPSHNRSPPN